MTSDKSFLTYNQQMKKLRTDKGIVCNGTPHKTSLVRSGYFNIINGYKIPVARMFPEIISIFKIQT